MDLSHRSFQLRLHAFQLIPQVQNDNCDIARLLGSLCYGICGQLFRVWEEDAFVSIDSLVIIANWTFKLNAFLGYTEIKLLEIIICLIQSKKLTKNEQCALINSIRRIGTEGKQHFLTYFIQRVALNTSVQQSGQFSFTTFSAIRLLIQCGADVNALSNHWRRINRPLHIIAKCSNILEAKPVIELLLACGAHPDAVDHRGVQPKDEAEVRDVKELLSTSRHLSLKCRCAQLIVSQEINYKHYFYPKLVEFIELHRKSDSPWTRDDLW
ncbi:unnamed protein product [Adineta ricciae]|uniref:Uncharacterized protein n=1 Tax=Adineta ricciae TaxID=249248 RepID=A0A814SJB3_ADIRI|nr:unnamed protein product [Adineta ricciae]CAF1672625.1 unnamed protein product [Adineta ricciae]